MVTHFDSILALLQAQLHNRPSSKVTLYTRPIPASRPRVSRWGTYYTKTYEAFRKEAIRLLAEVKTKAHTGPLAVLMELVVKPAASTVRSFPRGDNDNYEKAVWDSITKCGKVWEDDDQIVINATFKRYAKRGEPECIRLHIFELEAT